MGKSHADSIASVNGGWLVAVADGEAERLKAVREHLGQDIAVFEEYEAMLDSGGVDAVVVATPHYQHPEMAIKAFAKGLHVLIEKPAGVYTKQVRQMNAAAEESGKVFGIMFNQRSVPAHQKIKDLVD